MSKQNHKYLSYLFFLICQRFYKKKHLTVQANVTALLVQHFKTFLLFCFPPIDLAAFLFISFFFTLLLSHPISNLTNRGAAAFP